MLEVVSAAEWLVVLRVIIGLYWIRDGWSHLSKERRDGNHLEKVVSSFKPRTTVYRNFINEVVLTHPHTFAALTFSAMIFGGIFLVLGILTPVAGLVLAFLNVNLFLAGPRETSAAYNNAMFVAIHLLLTLSGAGVSYALLPMRLM